MMPRLLHWLALVACALAAFACSRPGPEWVRLAELEGEPARLGESGTKIVAGGVEYELVRDEDGAWIRTALAAEELPTGRAGRWRGTTTVRPVGAPPDGSSAIRLSSGERAFFDFAQNRMPQLKGGAEFGPGTFLVRGNEVLIQLEPDEEPPAAFQLEYSLTHGLEKDGVWHVRGQRFSGEGFSVWPGTSLSRNLRVPAGSSLRFATCAESAWVEPPGDERVRFRVLLDGGVLFDEEQDIGEAGSCAWHTVELPRGGVQRARLTFEVEGDFAYASFLSPVVGPAEIGEYGARPWDSTRGDVVVFLADTFRADNMSVYGGELGLTPNLDAFAETARTFLRAWSTSTHTLPAHSSLFTGLFPLQTGVWGHSTILPPDVETVGEVLTAHGYRTGAITDSVILSSYFGMAQGFALFDEHSGGLASTLERTRAFLDADDGRPAFLFVHTYRTHTPYVVTDRTRRERGEELGIEGTYEEWAEVVDGITRAERGDGPPKLLRPENKPPLEAMRRLYQGSVVDLDRWFAELLGELERHGLLERGHFLVTSDHGEAFGEHRDIYHSGPVYEEQTRVPLMVRGPGVEPRMVNAAASLVDVAPTLLDIAGLPPRVDWAGKSLLGLEEDRPVFLFQCGAAADMSTVGFLRGTRKIISSYTQLEAGQIGRAFDLDADPDEVTDLSDSAPWVDELFEQVGPAARELGRPLFDAERATLTADQRAELERLGYLGE